MSNSKILPNNSQKKVAIALFFWKRSKNMPQPFNPLESPDGARPTFSIPLNDGSNEQISIIVVHRNRPQYLNICLQSIHEMSHLNNYEVVVVDNGSDQETQEYLDVLQQEGIGVVRNDKNNYWSKAANQGVLAADPHSKYFVFLHADTVVLDPAWLDLLVNISAINSAGIVGTQLQHYFIQKQRVEFVQEWCMLMTRQCWEDIGPWPEELPLIGHSFIMTLRAQLKGYKPQASGNNIIHHYRQLCIDPSEFERIGEQAMGTVGKLYAATRKL
jgi:GT2 family glycosyltransferase